MFKKMRTVFIIFRVSKMMSLTSRTALIMMKKINIVSVTETDVEDFIEYYVSTKGDLAVCKDLILRSKLRQAEVKVNTQAQTIADQSKHMAVMQAQLNVSNEIIKTNQIHETKMNVLIDTLDKLADSLKDSQLEFKHVLLSPPGVSLTLASPVGPAHKVPWKARMSRSRSPQQRAPSGTRRSRSRSS